LWRKFDKKKNTLTLNLHLKRSIENLLKSKGLVGHSGKLTKRMLAMQNSPVSVVLTILTNFEMSIWSARCRQPALN